MKRKELLIHKHEATRRRIVETAREAFGTNGVRAVTMDQIAKRLAMSKRTLYELYGSKEELLLDCFKTHLCESEQHYETLKETADNVLDVVLMVFMKKLEELRSVSHTFLEELQSFPLVMKTLEENRTEQAQEAIEFLQRGVQQGYFRSDVNFHIVYQLCSRMLEYSLRAPSLSDFSPVELLKNTVLPYMRGCTTPKGAELMDNFLKKHTEH